MIGNLRVLMVTSEWPSDDQPFAAPFIVNQVRSLRELGVDVDVFPFRGARRPTNYLAARRRFKRQVINERYDVVHAQFGQSGALACFPKRMPLVVTFRGDDLEGIVGEDGRYLWSGKVLRRVSLAVANRADAVIVVSPHLARHLRRKPTAVIPSGIESDLFKPQPRADARSALGLPNDRKLVLFVGNPSETRKRLDLAKHSVALSGMGELLVAWNVPHKTVALYMNACDALIFTSMHEGSPNAVKEAVACNLPVVSVAVGDVREQLTGIDGCVVCPDDRPETLAAALRAVLERRQRIDGRARAAELDERALAHRVAEIYLRVSVDSRSRTMDSRSRTEDDQLPQPTARNVGYSQLRPEHAPEVARLHCACFPETFLSALGPRALARFYAWLAEHDAIGFVASVNGTLVGFAVGWYPANAWFSSLARDLRWSLSVGLVRGVLTSPGVMIRRLAERRHSFGRWFRAAGGRARPTASVVQRQRRASLDSIGVMAECRGAGIADELLDRFVEESFRRGAGLVTLSVRADNGRARRFYERRGWSLIGLESDGASARYAIRSKAAHGRE